MTEKFDSLGRRIPTFDRSAAGKKSARSAKENHGPDVHKRNGTIGGRNRKRGYLGTLKDEGKIDELKAITKKAGEASGAKTVEEKRTAKLKAWETRRKSTGSQNVVREGQK